MYRISGTFGAYPSAVQQEAVACTTLNSNEAFVVVEAGGANAWYWLGAGANEDEKNYAMTVGAVVAPGAAQSGFAEGEETDEFWAALGGKGEYASLKEMGVSPGFDPRLFHCSNSQGYFHMKEIYDFGQEDLNNNDVMVLDAFSTVYIWVGTNSNKHERKNVDAKVD